ncbi:SRPBCC domain-containing protein [Ramlibacter sp. AN1015]|uniref:SRPBCC domain-containing protein n=1 Tax=Ramlibacter sp. AN1015 TaxID=3133428 RepID=UPI0030BB1522
MRHALRTEIDVDASPARVWEVLLDFPAYPAWNPFIRSISGDPRPGARLEIVVQPPGGKSMAFKPRVLVARPAAELRWLGRLGVPGLFDGEHAFELAPLGGDRTRLVHSERFSGLLVPLLRASLDAGTRAGFEAMNRALKLRAEGAPAQEARG